MQTQLNSYVLVFSDGDSMTIAAHTIVEAVHIVGKKFNMLGLRRFRKNDGPLVEIVIEEGCCACFQSCAASIPCKCTLERAEEGAVRKVA